MAQPRSAQNIVPMTQVCTIVSANRPRALFTRLPPARAAPSGCPLFLPCTFISALLRFCIVSIYAERASPHRRFTAISSDPHYLIDGGHCAAMRRCFAAKQPPFWTQQESITAFAAEERMFCKKNTHMLPRERFAVACYCRRRWRRVFD